MFACPACLPECDMKFRFCGGEDCPEWLGAEIATIAKVSSVRIRLLAKKIVQAYVSASKGLDENEARKAADKLKGNSNVVQRKSKADFENRDQSMELINKNEDSIYKREIKVHKGELYL